jgi:hypothetical protein
MQDTDLNIQAILKEKDADVRHHLQATRKRALAFLDVPEWERLVDDSVGAVYFQNNVTGEISW